MPLWSWYRPTNPDFQLSERLSIAPRLGIEYGVGLDGIGLAFVWFAGAVCLAAMWMPAPESDTSRRPHFSWILAHYSALLGGVLATSSFLFALAWVVAIATLWPLCARREDGSRVDATRKWVLFGLTRDARRSVSPVAVLLLTTIVTKMGVYGAMRFGLPLLPAVAPSVALRVPGWALGVALAAAARAGWASQWVRTVAYVCLAQAAIVIAAFASLTPLGISSGIRLTILYGLCTTAALVATYASVAVPLGARASSLRMALSPMVAVFLSVATIVGGLPAVFASASESVSALWSVGGVAATVVSLALLVVAGRLALAAPMEGAPALARTRRPVGALAVAATLASLGVWVAMNPAPVEQVLRVPALKLAARVDARYQSEFVTACDTTVTPEMKAASPAAQFLAAAPCGPDGKPLEGRVSAPSGGAVPAPIAGSIVAGSVVR